MREDGAKRTFLHPGPEWRGAPFWSWNDDLDPEELRRQVREMKRAGLGGFFMHNRIGLITPFMGERWMECIAAAVDEARRQRMQAWLYDEDRWPSGYGGGMVVRRNPEFAMHYLEMNPPEDVADYRFAVVHGNGDVRAYRRLGPKQRPREGESLQRFAIRVPPPSPWFDGLPYADNMNPASVQSFISFCYEPYRERFSHEFGKTIPGIFTDEPNIFSAHELPPGRRVPWTPRLPREFRQRRGYDLLARLPELFSSSPDFFKTRHDFWRTVTELFAEAYCGQLGAWCEENGLELTGHMLMEQDFDAIPVGGAAMPSLRHMQRPGIDILTEQTQETLTCKQASSIAHQLGRSRTLSETYGTSGWHMTFEGQKWSGDWQTVLGISTRCQHLTPYSIRGMRKRDYPPTFSWHQPWWRYFPVIEDYFARACFFTTLGKPVREVLLLHNVATAWGEAPTPDARRRHSDHLNQVAEDLLALHYDFDLGDETIIAERGSVKGRRFIVGEASYKLVVVPACETLFASTVNLLRRFLEAGGKVIALRPRPTRTDGRSAADMASLFAHENVTTISAARAELEDALRSILPRRVSITGEGPRQVGAVIYQERRHRGRSLVMLANRDREAGHRLAVELPGEGRVERWDLETGHIGPLSARAAAGKTTVEICLPPTGSAALSLDPKGQTSRRAARPRKLVKDIALKDEWRVRRTRENSLVLDACRWRFTDGEWSKLMPVFLAQRQLRERMGLPDVSGPGLVQPWRRYARPSRVPPRPVELGFSFRVHTIPENGMDLVVESAELFEILLNGRQIPSSAHGWWLDKSMDRVALPGIKRGDNELVLRCEYRDAPEYEIEECYLIGDFGVDRGSDQIVREPQFLKAGDWCDQGYPYYAGNLVYGQEMHLRPTPGERALLRVGSHFGSCIAVHVNGRLAGVRGWPPYEVDITSKLKSGRNLIEVEVCGSPRNLLGPNHLPEKRPAWTGPAEFIRLDRWVEERNLVPYGLFGEVTLAVLR